MIQANGGILELQDVSLQSTGVLQATDDGTLEQNGGTVTAVSIDIVDGGAFDLNSGRLETPQFNGDFFQDGGTFAPGNAPGQANGVGDSTLTGNYSIDDSNLSDSNNATLEIELATRILFDRLNVGGNLNLLNGQLSVVALDGFSVSAGDNFDIIDIAGNRSGMFLGLDEGDQVPGSGFGGSLSITYAAGDGNDIALVSTLTPGSVNFPVAGTSDVAFVFTTRVPTGAGDDNIDLQGLDILPGGDFTLGPNETINLDNGNGTLFVSEGSTFTGNGIVNGNIRNAGLVRIPIVALTQTRGGFVQVISPTPVVSAPTAVTVNRSTVVRTNAVSTIQTPSVMVEGTLAFDASLEVTGDFTQTDTGSLRLFIGGDTPGISFSQLEVGQTVALDGQVQVVFRPELFGTFDFEPEAGDTFDFIVADGGVTLSDDLEFITLVTAAGAGFFNGFDLTEFDSGISSDPDDLLTIAPTAGAPLFEFSLVEGGTVLRGTLTTAIPEPGVGVMVVGGLMVLLRRRKARVF